MSLEVVNPLQQETPVVSVWNINVLYHMTNPASFDHLEEGIAGSTTMDAVELFSQFTANIIREMTVFTR